MRRARVALAALVLAALVAGCAGLPGSGRSGVAAHRRVLDDALRAAERDPALGRGRLDAFLRTHPGSPLYDDAALEAARLARAAGDDAAAERALRSALARQPRGDRADAVRVELADLALARGDREAAVAVRAGQVGDQPRGARPLRVAQQAEAHALGFHPRGLAVAAGQGEVGQLDAERPRAARLVADLARANGDRRLEVDALTRLREAQPAGATAAIDAELGRALDELSTEALLQIAEGLGARPSAGIVWLEIGERALHERNEALAIRAFSRSERTPLAPGDAARRERMAAVLEGRAPPGGLADAPPRLADLGGELALPDTSVLSGAIGVALPLSGPFAAVGEQTLRGVLLAAGVYGPGAGVDAVASEAAAPAGGLHVVVRDTGGTPGGAAAAVRELAARPDVNAIVGPLLTEEVQAAADAAQETGVPLLVLSRHESVTRPTANVFRLGTTRRMEADALADHAVRGRGMRRFAILYPKDDYGREFEELLWQAVEARGGRVVGVEGYAPGSQDLSAPIRGLVGWSLLDDAQRARLAARETEQAQAAAAGAGVAPPGAGGARAAAPLFGEGFSATDPEEDALPPIVDFDALFVPDAPDMVGLLAPQLAMQGVDGVVLFGPSAWHHPELLRGGGTRLEGAFFTSSFDPAHPAPLVQEFARRYGSAFGEDASAFAAQGFDAANLVAIQLARGAGDREEVRRALLDTELYPGVSGPTTFEADGNARKRPFVIGVESGRLVPLD